MPGRWPMCGPPTDLKPGFTDIPPTPIWRAAPPPHPLRDLLLNTAVALAHRRAVRLARRRHRDRPNQREVTRWPSPPPSPPGHFAWPPALPSNGPSPSPPRHQASPVPYPIPALSTWEYVVRATPTDTGTPIFNITTTPGLYGLLTVTQTAVLAQVGLSVDATATAALQPGTYYHCLWLNPNTTGALVVFDGELLIDGAPPP